MTNIYNFQYTYIRVYVVNVDVIDLHHVGNVAVIVHVVGHVVNAVVIVVPFLGKVEGPKSPT